MSLWIIPHPQGGYYHPLWIFGGVFPVSIYYLGIFPTHRGDIPPVDKGGRIYPPYSSACRKSRLKEAGAQGWEPLSPGRNLPSKQKENKKIKIAL